MPLVEQNGGVQADPCAECLAFDKSCPRGLEVELTEPLLVAQFIVSPPPARGCRIQIEKPADTNLAPRASFTQWIAVWKPDHAVCFIAYLSRPVWVSYHSLVTFLITGSFPMLTAYLSYSLLTSMNFVLQM